MAFKKGGEKKKEEKKKQGVEKKTLVLSTNSNTVAVTSGLWLLQILLAGHKTLGKMTR
jgi:hypothetical protein